MIPVQEQLKRDRVLLAMKWFTGVFKIKLSIGGCPIWLQLKMFIILVVLSTNKFLIQINNTNQIKRIELY